jgi:hypothetical protein
MGGRIPGCRDESLRVLRSKAKIVLGGKGLCSDSAAANAAAKSHVCLALITNTLDTVWLRKSRIPPAQRKNASKHREMQQPSSADIELGALPAVDRDGYRTVAAWIARDPDNETFIYRRFDQLSARNLLYLQSEVLVLERRLERLDAETAKSADMELKDSARRWEIFSKNAENRVEERARMDLVFEIRAKIKEYRKSESL